jgi:hypothetical protein
MPLDHNPLALEWVAPKRVPLRRARQLPQRQSGDASCFTPPLQLHSQGAIPNSLRRASSLKRLVRELEIASAAAIAVPPNRCLTPETLCRSSFARRV